MRKRPPNEMEASDRLNRDRCKFPILRKITL
ncbi:Hypothetical protein DEACI_0528 [Acididesulfobacillus acetoxydans]|uniref:Uncharacterized protein n=1 Tax=Acididesulfobacillus acetoxydans TaxID=1561005 RepID=A0A8S0WL91_9FIRM|nr:Hypothetical protein DEACI_0528 [Acididesulfobacillus acetoxydans]CEJ08962.1 Hypothetical protein DEACI_3444 [Acididesulfobacillus acetoxydans]